MLEWEDIAILYRVFIEQVLFYLVACQLKSLFLVHDNAIVLSVLAIEHFPSLHAPSLEIAIY
jgi:hypothetical protein